MGLGLGQIDHIIRLITISVITLSGFHCSRNIIIVWLLFKFMFILLTVNVLLVNHYF
jgi:hypothetical protein